MANTLLTPTIIAKQALMILRNNCILAGLVHTDYSEEFVRVGDTITIRKPASFAVNDFTSTLTVQDATEQSVSVRLDKHKNVAFAVTNRELTLSLQDFSAQFLQPAMVALAQQLDSDIAGLYKDVPYRYGTAGTVPSTLADIAGARAILSKNKAPIDARNLVLDPDAQASLGTLDVFTAFDSEMVVDLPDGLRKSALGRVQGFDSYMDQNVVTHTPGAGTVAVDLVAGYAAGDTEIHVDGVTTALKVGDLLTIATKPYVVTVAGTLTGADQDITIYPGLAATTANDAPVTVAAAHSNNLAFHRNAFALVSRPLAVPMGPAQVSYQSFDGLTIRVAIGFDINTLRDICSLDVLYGVKTLYPELACRLIG